MALVASGLQVLVLVRPAPWSVAPASTVLASTPALVVGALLLVGFLVAETWAVHVRTGRETVTLTLSDVPLVVALFFLGPLAVIGLRIAGAAPVLVVRSRTNPRKLAFNLVWFWLEACTAVLVWQVVVGQDHELRPLVWLAAGATTVVLDLLGTLLISLVMAADAGVRPDLREVFSESNPLVALVNAAAALLVVHVAVADWRALWTVAVVVAVLAFAQQAHNRQRRRSDSLEQLGRFTGALGDQLDVSSASLTALTWMTHQLRAEVVELVLPAGFAGAERGWRVAYDGTVTEVRGRGLAGVLTEELAAGPVLVKRTERGRHVSQRLREEGLRDAMAMHLLGDGDRIGTLVVGQRLSAVETFQRSDLDELLALGNHLSVTLRNARRADLIREHAQEELPAFARRRPHRPGQPPRPGAGRRGAAGGRARRRGRRRPRPRPVHRRERHPRPRRGRPDARARRRAAGPARARGLDGGAAARRPLRGAAARRARRVGGPLRDVGAGGVRDPVLAGLAGGRGLGAPRPRGRPAGHAPGRPAAAGRHRGRGGVVAPHRARGVQRHDGGGQPGPADPADRAEARDPRRRAAGAPAAAGAGERRPAHRRRGARALAAPAPRAPRAGRVRPARREQRADHVADVGRARAEPGRVRAVAALRSRARRRREHLAAEPAGRRLRHRGRAPAARQRRPGHGADAGDHGVEPDGRPRPRRRRAGVPAGARGAALGRRPRAPGTRACRTCTGCR